MSAQSDTSQKAVRARIETQIHRRKKAKALSPLEVEWERIDRKTSTNLRMSSTLITTRSPKGKTSPKA